MTLNVITALADETSALMKDRGLPANVAAAIVVRAHRQNRPGAVSAVCKELSRRSAAVRAFNVERDTLPYRKEKAPDPQLRLTLAFA